jgi:hypothetical protein
LISEWIYFMNELYKENLFLQRLMIIYGKSKREYNPVKKGIAYEQSPH